MDLISSLELLCNAAGVGGLDQAADVAEKMLSRYCDMVERDALGSIIGIIKSNKKDAPVIMLEAHIDEIGLIVTRIDDSGFIYTAPCGGVDVRTLPAAEIIVYGDKPYNGVFCSTPPHLKDKDKKDKLPEIADMGIDVGLDGETAKRSIRKGDRVSFSPNFKMINDNRISSKSLDDRAGVASILYCLDLLKKENIEFKCDVAVVFAVQEELGCRGSAVSSYRINPDYAVAVDVSYARTPDADSAKCGELGKGAMIGWSPTLDVNMTRKLVSIAEKHGISYQHEVMGGLTGTDADSISDTRTGTRTALLSIPLRYMHTPYEVADKRDIESIGRLLSHFIKEGVSDL
jgi:putative aminopeptidase FrvX